MVVFEATRNALRISWREVGFVVLIVRSIMDTLGLDCPVSCCSIRNIKGCELLNDLRGNPDGYTSNLALQVGQDSCNSLSSAGGCWNDVIEDSSAYR